MIRFPLILLTTFMLVTALNCRSSDAGSVPEQRAADSTQKVIEQMPMPPPGPIQPPAIKPNMTFVGAAVDSVIQIDSVRYKAYLWISTAFAEGGLESFLEPGQRIVAEPQYDLAPDSSISLSHPRNAKLFRLYRMMPTDGFVGRISMIPGRGWVIVDVEN